MNAESLPIQLIYWLGLDESGRHGAGARVWETLCSRSESVVEIGANVGFYAVPGALAARGAYRAFEPHPRSACVLRENLAVNGVEHVRVIEAAVVPDDWDEPVALASPAGSDWATPASARVAHRGEAAIEVEGVAVRAAIDDCDLLKIDVEGFEAELLEPSLPLLARLRPLLVVEVLDGNAELRALLPELVRDLDGTLFAVRRSSLTPVDVAKVRHGPLNVTYGTWDYLIVPATRSQRVAGLIQGDAVPSA